MMMIHQLQKYCEIKLGHKQIYKQRNGNKNLQAKKVYSTYRLPSYLAFYVNFGKTVGAARFPTEKIGERRPPHISGTTYAYVLTIV